MAVMKPLHAAALAMVGWYLMMPPVHDGQPDTQAPISAWKVFRTFDSTAACQEWKLKLETRARRAGRYGPRPDFMCIASDDPRLKEK
jgi:hypothetical protein